MKEKNLVVGLDIGTTKVCTIVGVQSSPSDGSGVGDIEIIGIGTHPSQGLKKGTVVNINKTIRSIQCSLEEARLMAGVSIESATVGIAGGHIYSFNSSGVAAIQGGEVTRDDISRVLEVAEAVVIPSDREILHIIPQEFRVDNTSGIKDPTGMCGVRLEVCVHIVTGAVSRIQNLVKCVEQTGVQAVNVVLQPVASSESVLSVEEKEMGTVILDIGGGTTDIAIWKNGSIVHTQIVPVGGNHFTNDLAVGLKVSHAEAERVKINHGSVLAEKLNQSANITIQGMPNTPARDVQLSVIAEILGSRAEELFGITKDVIETRGFGDSITGGVILTGGGALIDGLPELGEYILELPTKIGYPMSFGGMTNIMRDPKFSTVLGLVLEASKQINMTNEKDIRITHGDLMQKFSSSLKSAFREIF